MMLPPVASEEDGRQVSGRDSQAAVVSKSAITNSRVIGRTFAIVLQIYLNTMLRRALISCLVLKSDQIAILQYRLRQFIFKDAYLIL